jgi:hypothetical protein
MSIDKISPEVRLAAVFRRVLLVMGFYALGCAPAILIAERFGWSQWPLHSSQLLAVVVCLLAGLGFLWSTRGDRIRGFRLLAMLAVGASGLWLAFVAFVIAALAISMRGFD